MVKYKLTNKNMRTYGGFQWELGVLAHKENDVGEKGLCSDVFYHWYHSPLMAVLMNSINSDIDDPRLFECEVGGEVRDEYGLKGGSTSCMLVRELELPVITNRQRVAFGILCAIKVHKDEYFSAWAVRWLSGEDRTEETAAAVEQAMEKTEPKMKEQALDEEAMVAARMAARAAARTAGTWLVEVWAAESAAAAARIGSDLGKELDIQSIAEQAVKDY